jgi:antitoxin (DNA-binding transcriptional repressor) of toxin-antitoxin stability system
MTHRPIIDAGPSLNFLSAGKTRLLISVLGQLSAPEAVRAEVLRKSRQDERFRAAATTWRKLSPTWMQILSDDETPELARTIQRMTRLPMERRLRSSKDLGETMVIAHAVVAAEAGEPVTILIDDGPGARLAGAEIRRLTRLQAADRKVGSISLISSLIVLERAAKTEHIPDKATMRATYEQLRGLDDGLPRIEETKLLSPVIWS